MVDPLFWLGLSIVLVAVSLTAVLVAALPALRELARAARSAEKLFDTLSRELPPTLESIRLTSLEISDLTDDMSQGVQSAGRVAQQVDQSINGAKKQATQVHVATRSAFAGFKAAWKFLNRPEPPPRSRNLTPDSPDLLPPTTRPLVDDRRDGYVSSKRIPAYEEAGFSEQDHVNSDDQRSETNYAAKQSPSSEGASGFSELGGRSAHSVSSNHVDVPPEPANRPIDSSKARSLSREYPDQD